MYSFTFWQIKNRDKSPLVIYGETIEEAISGHEMELAKGYYDKGKILSIKNIEIKKKA